MRKYFTFWNTLPVLLIILGVLLLIGRFLIKRNFKKPTTTDDLRDEPEVIEDEPTESREERIITHFKLLRKELPPAYSDNVVKMITAHAMHETGIFTSGLYESNNNLFGMKHPEVRETLSLGRENGFAKYASLENSVADLLLYFKEFGYPTKYLKIDDYVKLLKKNGYFTAGYVDYFNPTRTHFNTVRELIQ